MKREVGKRRVETIKRIKKGGMYTNREHEIDYKIDMQIPLKNLNTVKKEWLDWDVDTRNREIQAIESTQTIRENE